MLLHGELKDLDETHPAFKTHGGGGGFLWRVEPSLGGPPLRGPL